MQSNFNYSSLNDSHKLIFHSLRNKINLKSLKMILLDVIFIEMLEIFMKIIILPY